MRDHRTTTRACRQSICRSFMAASSVEPRAVAGLPLAADPPETNAERAAAPEPTSAYIPPRHPVSRGTPVQDPRAGLTAEQASALARVVAEFAAPSFTLPLPTAAPPEGITPVVHGEELSEHEEMWLSEECFLVRLAWSLICACNLLTRWSFLLQQRYLRATNWKEADARKRLIDTVRTLALSFRFAQS